MWFMAVENSLPGVYFLYPGLMAETTLQRQINYYEIFSKSRRKKKIFFIDWMKELDWN